jgi:DNA-binding transcriptional MerR regulator
VIDTPQRLEPSQSIKDLGHRHADRRRRGEIESSSCGVGPDRESGQRRYDESVLGRLAFIGVAQAAGFKLPEIKQLVGTIDGGQRMSGSMRSLSVRKLDEVEELLARTQAMKGWLEVARSAAADLPPSPPSFPAPGETSSDAPLRLVQVNGRDCRRQPA